MMGPPMGFDGYYDNGEDSEMDDCADRTIRIISIAMITMMAVALIFQHSTISSLQTEITEMRTLMHKVEYEK